MRLEDRPDAPHSDRRDEAALAGRMALEMQAKLADNRGKLHWRHPDVDDGYLVERLADEVLEMLDAPPTEVWSEAADVANFAAMIADRREASGRDGPQTEADVLRVSAPPSRPEYPERFARGARLFQDHVQALEDTIDGINLAGELYSAQIFGSNPGLIDWGDPNVRS